MSTRDSLYCEISKEEHGLNIHIYRDFHEPPETIVIELSCSTCNSLTMFLINEHLGVQLSEKLEELERFKKKLGGKK